MGIAHRDGTLFRHGANTVGNDAILGEVPAADHVPGPGGGNGDIPLGKETVAITVGDQFGTGLGIGIGIEAVQGLVFPVAPDPFVVVVHLVRGDVEHAPNAVREPHAFHDVDRPHHVGFIGVHRINVTVPHDGLRRHVDDDFGLYLREDPL